MHFLSSCSVYKKKLIWIIRMAFWMSTDLIMASRRLEFCPPSTSSYPPTLIGCHGKNCNWILPQYLNPLEYLFEISEATHACTGRSFFNFPFSALNPAQGHAQWRTLYSPENRLLIQSLINVSSWQFWMSLIDVIMAARSPIFITLRLLHRHVSS
jgi:hypothetical protein